MKIPESFTNQEIEMASSIATSQVAREWRKHDSLTPKCAVGFLVLSMKLEADCYNLLNAATGALHAIEKKKTIADARVILRDAIKQVTTTQSC